jgi:hypothetical protein
MLDTLSRPLNTRNSNYYVMGIGSKYTVSVASLLTLLHKCQISFGGKNLSEIANAKADTIEAV